MGVWAIVMRQDHRHRDYRRQRLDTGAPGEGGTERLSQADVMTGGAGEVGRSRPFWGLTVLDRVGIVRPAS